MNIIKQREKDQIQIIILAGGIGKRMNNESLPKVLAPFKGKTLIEYVVEAVKESGVCPKPVVVVGKMAELIEEKLGLGYDYVLQEQQLGTGHAVMCARALLENKAKNIMVLYGDMPLITPMTINRLAEMHLEENRVLTMATVEVENFKDWRANFYDFGRVIRDSYDQVREIVEKKDATLEQLEIKEVNPSYFCFQANWLWQNLDKIKNNNAQGEYYLTDLAAIACQEGYKIATLPINPVEAVGVNTAEQLDLAQNLNL